VSDESTASGAGAAKKSGGAYKDGQEALLELKESFNDWTGALSDRAVQLSYALLAANWAVFATTDRLLANRWAVASFALVVVFLVVNLLITRIYAEKIRARFRHAEKNRKQWEKDCERTRGEDDPWPYTKETDNWSRGLREVRTWLPLLAGLAFLIAIFHAHSTPPAEAAVTSSSIEFVLHGEVGPFETGKHDQLERSAESSLDSVLASVVLTSQEHDLMALVIVGSADRRILLDPGASRYGGDYGLSSARSVWVQDRLLELQPADATRLLTLSRGPSSGDAMAQDRSVAVFGLWSEKTHHK
jgi:hypothetical protein